MKFKISPNPSLEKRGTIYISSMFMVQGSKLEKQKAKVITISILNI